MKTSILISLLFSNLTLGLAEQRETNPALALSSLTDPAKLATP
jgi:hypothetical protein